MPRSPKKVLLQTQVAASVGKRFDELARANGHKRASYLRFVIEMFVLDQQPTRPHISKRLRPKSTLPLEAKT